MFQSRHCFWRYFIWPFSFPTNPLSFLPGIYREMSVRSKNQDNQSQWCSSISLNLRQDLFLLVNFILRKFYSSSLATSFLFKGILGRAFFTYFRDRDLVALVKGEQYGSVTSGLDDDWKIDPASSKSDVIWKDSLTDTSKDALSIFVLYRQMLFFKARSFRRIIFCLTFVDMADPE